MSKRKSSKTGTKMTNLIAKGRAGVVLAVNTVATVAVGVLAIQAALTVVGLMVGATQSAEGALSLLATGLIGYLTLKTIK